QPAAELREGGQRLQKSRDLRGGPRPAERISNLAPAVEQEGGAPHHPQEQEGDPRARAPHGNPGDHRPHGPPLPAAASTSPQRIPRSLTSSWDAPARARMRSRITAPA